VTKSIIYIPGKGRKPEPQVHKKYLRDTLCNNVRKNCTPQDSELAEDFIRNCSYQFVAWNYDFYGEYYDIEKDLQWIERLHAGETDRERVINYYKGFGTRIQRFFYLVVDRFPKLIDWFADERIKRMMDGSMKYFSNRDGIADKVRGLTKDAIKKAVEQNHEILLISHSMGSIIALEACLELSQEYDKKVIHSFFTMGSPLGLKFTQDRLLTLNDASQIKDRYPSIIKHWKNFSATGDMVSTDKSLKDDFAIMIEHNLIDTIEDYDNDVYNLYEDDQGFNPHRSYGYLANPLVAQQVLNWWRK